MHDGITVNVVHPHSIHTPRRAEKVSRRAAQTGESVDEINRQLAAQVALGRILVPEDVAPLVVFLASRLASAVTGQAIAVDGGALRTINY